jgi:hypothetical protein
MCRCVDFGSTNTSFLSVRLIGGVSSERVCGGERPALILRSRYIGAADKVNQPTTPDLGALEAPAPLHMVIFGLTQFGHVTSMPSRGTSSAPTEGGDAVAKKKATKKKKK